MIFANDCESLPTPSYDQKEIIMLAYILVMRLGIPVIRNEIPSPEGGCSNYP